MSEQPNNPNTAPDAAPAPQQAATDLAALPTPEAPQEQQGAYNAVREQLEAKVAGAFENLAPKTPGDYRFEPLNDLSAQDVELETAARSAFHAEGFDNGTARTLVDLWNKAATAPALNQAQEAAEFAATERALRQKWGADFDRNMKTVRAEVARIGAAHPSLPLRHMLQTTSLGNNVWLAATLLNRAQARSK